MTEPETQAILDDLVDEHLLHLTTAARYGMHDLVRRYLNQHRDPDTPRYPGPR